MSSEESLETRQESEFHVLKAIYGNELTDLRKSSSCGKWSPLHVSISLTPQQANSGIREVYARVDLRVICSHNYPFKAPQLCLENERGMSQINLSNLQSKLECLSKKSEGEVMIHNLCEEVRKFLFDHNQPGMNSLHDEMLRTQEQKKQVEQMQKQLEEEKQKENMMIEVQKRQELLKSEERQRSTSENELDHDLHRRSIYSNRKSQSSNDSGDESMCDHKGTVLLDFSGREIQRGQCIRHVEPNNVLFTGIDTESGEVVEISQWEVLVKNDYSTQLEKTISSIEHEFNYLTKLNNPNLAHYLGIKHEIIGNHVVIYILKEFVYGSSCYSLFSSPKVKVDVDYLRHIAKGVLHAIEYMHRNKVVHKDIRDTFVHVGEKGLIKVSDFSIHKRLIDLISYAHCSYTEKTDIFDFGKFILTLLGQEPAEGNITIPNFLHSQLYDFLSKCLNEDDRKRLTANELLHHSFFNKPIVHFSPHHIAPEVPIERNVSPEITQNLLSLSNSAANGQSRIHNEFEIMEHVGEGAFGDVQKARNKLDGGYYAIKRIKLNPKNKVLNKKILTEVTLLSRLNHENIVRYYSAWIETTTIKNDVDEDSNTTTTAETESNEKNAKEDQLNIYNDIENLAPPMKNIEIAITFDSKSQPPYNESDDDDDDEEEDYSDEEDAFSVSPREKFDQDSNSDSIQFESGSHNKSSSKNSPSDDSKKTHNSKEVAKEVVKQRDHLYIQMEFCEKSTLRTAIDGNLYLDQNRVWRLFREIIEGLVYIHQQRIIHRDLKPVNIFLDSHDHVKIGDFGLATTIAIRSKHGDCGITKSEVESLREELGDESKTGHIGTALYIAPEINTAFKANYNQKVDIYSLGIIFFEMCYPALATAMERNNVLTNLRSKDICFPADFPEKSDRARALIRWLLNHDISKRPTSQELLQSEHVPPPVLEERELQEMVRHTLSYPQLKGYRYLMASCFKQRLTLAQDITYDRDPSISVNSKPLNLYEFVKDTCIKIFRQHGGQNLTTPLLMPKSKYHDHVESCVNLMTHFGNVVSIPHDLRVPFARYIVWNNITLFRRYAIERVFHERKVFGFSPREFYECAFDIVSPTKGHLMSDAEILYVVYEIIKELPGVRNKNFVIKLNHTDLVKAIFLHCGLKDKHEELFCLLLDAKEGKIPKSEVPDFLIQRGLSDSMIRQLINFLQSEFEITKAANHLQMITKKKTGEACDLAKLALEELKKIVRNAELYGIEFDFVIAPGLTYNIHYYKGMICQFVCEVNRKRKHNNKEIIATGGRYDGMISYYRSIIEQANIHTKDIQQAAVGISISLDKLVQAIQKQENEDIPRRDALDVIVCSIGSNQMMKAEIKVLKELWAAGIKCALLEEKHSVDIQDQFIKLGASYAIIFKDSDEGKVRVKSWDVDARESYNRCHDKEYRVSELMDNLTKIIKVRNEGFVENTQFSNALSRSESKMSSSDRSDLEPVVEVSVISSEKSNSNLRRRYENQVYSKLESLFKKFSGYVTVIAVTADADIVRTLASFLEFHSESSYSKSVEDCIGKHQKYKQYLNEICEEIWKIKTKKTNPTIVLYSLSHNFYKLII